MSYSTMVGYKKGRLEMKALRKLGKGAESVQLCEVEKPIPGPNDLLVKVMAAVRICTFWPRSTVIVCLLPWATNIPA